MSDNFTNTCLRCKDIGYKIKAGASIEDVRSILEKEAPVKVVNKSYDSIPHLSKSRLGEGDRHIDIKQEELMTVKLPETRCILIIEEKMDGSNCAVIRHKGEIVAIGRSGYRCSESSYEQHKMFARYVEKHKSQFDKLLPHEGDKVVGEWLAMAHGTLYPNITNPYQVFDLFLDGQRCSFTEKDALFFGYGFTQVAKLFTGEKPVSIEMAMDLLLKHNPLAEGVVYRLEVFNKKKDRYIPHLIAKVVRQDKEDGKYFGQEPIWLWKEK